MKKKMLLQLYFHQTVADYFEQRASIPLSKPKTIEMHKSVIVFLGFAAIVIAHASSEDTGDTSLIIDGVDVRQLTEKELQIFGDALDEKFAGELDIRAFKTSLAERTTGRQKRFAFTTLALLTGKLLLKSLATKAAWSVGKKLYKKYTTDYDYYYDDMYYGLRPENSRSITLDSGERVMMGEIGDIKVTARSSRPSGLPTLVFSGEKVVREIQFAGRRK